MNSPWTEDIEAELAILMTVKPPLTYEAIADCLNLKFDTAFTKNACIGKGRRIAARKQRAAGTGNYQRKPSTYRHPVAAEKPKPAVKWGETTIMQLDNHTCRWPVTDGLPPYLYCGIPPVEGSPYCFKHSRLAYPAMGRH